MSQRRLLETTQHGQVYLKSNRVVKEITYQPEEYAVPFLLELEILNRYRHPHLIEGYGCRLKDSRLKIYMQEADLDLVSLLETQTVKLDDLLVYFYQVALALDFLHQQQTLHLDIKPENILVRVDDRKAYLADFGLSKLIHRQSTGIGGTIFYLPPEILATVVDSTFKVVLDPSLDVWELGICFFHLFSWHQFMAGGAQPINLGQLDDVSNYYQLLQEKFSQDHRLDFLSQHLPTDLVQLFDRILQLDSTKRPSLSWIIQEVGQLVDQPIPRVPGYVLRDPHRSLSQEENQLVEDIANQLEVTDLVIIQKCRQLLARVPVSCLEASTRVIVSFYIALSFYSCQPKLTYYLSKLSVDYSVEDFHGDQKIMLAVMYPKVPSKSLNKLPSTN